MLAPQVVRYLCACRGDVCKATSKPVVTQLISGEDAQTRGDVLPEAPQKGRGSWKPVAERLISIDFPPIFP